MSSGTASLKSGSRPRPVRCSRAGSGSRHVAVRRVRRARPGGAPDDTPRGSRRLVAGAGPARSDRGARGPGGHAGAGAGPDPLRADARLPVHVLPRRGGRDGGGSGGDSGFGHCRAGVRRRPHLELRGVRRSGPQARLRSERLRRDAARTVGVGRQADGGQRRDRRPRRRAAGRAPASARDRLRAGVPRGDARLRGREPSRRLVRPPERERAGRALRRAGWAEGPDPVREAVRQGPAQDEPAGGHEADRAGRRRAALSQRPAAAGPAPRAVRRRPTRRTRPTTCGS